MPDPRYPHQIVSMDIAGPFTRSARGNIYLLNFVDHLTGWADCYPLRNKRGETVADILQREYFPRYGSVEVVTSDRGGEFQNSAVRAILRACDVEHRMTTPYRPQANAKVERFHRTLKGILGRLMAGSRSDWESGLGAALTIYRSTVSSATGYTPFQALYGRQMRIPLTKAIREGPADAEFEDDRVATLARIWIGAREALRQEREANEAQQRRKRLSGELHTGDSVIILTPGLKRTFQPKWEAWWQVIRTRHPVYWIRHLPSGREKVLHREKLRWVPPDIDWKTAPEQLDIEDQGLPDDWEPFEEVVTSDVGTEGVQGDPGLIRQTPIEGRNDTPQSTDVRGPSSEAGSPPAVDTDPTPAIQAPEDDGGDAPLPMDISDRDSDAELQEPERETPPPGRSERRVYPRRRRRPPRYLDDYTGWERRPSKRGRLAPLDFWAFW